jgi:hypothetical protein
MSVSIPRERCYYFECADGQVRLTLFIPPEDLGRMISARKVSTAVRKDFPDGVDLDCTEPDFAAFETQYGYRPEHDAELLRGAFFAIFSSTRGWQTYRGSGLIPAVELESKIAEVDRTVRRQIPPVDQPIQPESAPRPVLPLAQRRRRAMAGARGRGRVEQALARLRVKGIDQAKPIDKQPFTRTIRWSRGRKAQEVFSLLQRKQRRAEE